MKSILLQIVVLFCAIAAIAGIKYVQLPVWATIPLVGGVLLLAILGFVYAHCDWKAATEHTATEHTVGLERIKN
jgi:hypothetical protein